MDKYSKERLEEVTNEVVKQGHLGELNKEKEVNVQISVQKGRKAPLPPNIMVMQKFAYLSATQLKPASTRVLMLFFAMAGYENYVGMDVKTIQEELGIKSKMTIVSALKELQENNIIIKIENVTDRRRNDYFINPLSAWKGNSNTRKKMHRNLAIHTNQLSLFPETENEISDDSQLDDEKITKGNLPTSNWEKKVEKHFKKVGNAKHKPMIKTDISKGFTTNSDIQSEGLKNARKKHS